MFHADLDIVKQFIVGALFSVHSLGDKNWLQSCEAKDDAGSKPTSKNSDNYLDYIICVLVKVDVGSFRFTLKGKRHCLANHR